MAQRSSQSPHDANWETNFLPSFFDGSTVSSPGVAALSSNNNGYGQYTSANSTLFPVQADYTLQPPFTINPANGTNLKVEQESQKLLEILLQKAGPTKQKIRDNILKDIREATSKDIRDLTKDIRTVRAEVKQLRSAVAEMEKLWTQWLSYQ
jgi:hypothetical protein